MASDYGTYPPSTWVDALRNRGRAAQSLERDLRRWDDDKARLLKTPPRPDPLPAHVGLWLDRCLFEPGATRRGAGIQVGEKHGRRVLYEAAIKALEPSAPHLAFYRRRFEAWRRLAGAPPTGVLRKVYEAEATSRILLHADVGGTVTEGGLLLHHTYGVPMISGSALKGVARSYGRRHGRGWFADLTPEGGKGGEAEGDPEWLRLLFGDTDAGGEGGSASVVNLWDALWIPPSRGESPLALDVVNPHHPDYYTGSSAPTPGDSPVPTHRLTVRPGARFLIVAECHVGVDPEAAQWLDLVMTRLLAPALALEGVGGRIRAGFGRLSIDGLTVATDGGGGAGPTAPTAEIVLGHVSYQPGPRILTATLSDGRRAEVRGEEGQRMLKGLSEQVQKKIRKKSQQLNVKVDPLGNAWKIIALYEG